MLLATMAYQMQLASRFGALGPWRTKARASAAGVASVAGGCLLMVSLPAHGCRMSPAKTVCSPNGDCPGSNQSVPISNGEGTRPSMAKVGAVEMVLLSETGP